MDLKDVDEVNHMILYLGAFSRRKSDLVRVIAATETYQVPIQREPEDFRKINELIHSNNWSNKLKTKGDATNIKEIIRRREEGWIK